MTVALVLVGWVVLSIPAALFAGWVLRRNGQHYPVAPVPASVAPRSTGAGTRTTA